MREKGISTEVCIHGFCLMVHISSTRIGYTWYVHVDTATRYIPYNIPVQDFLSYPQEEGGPALAW